MATKIKVHFTITCPIMVISGLKLNANCLGFVNETLLALLQVDSKYGRCIRSDRVDRCRLAAGSVGPKMATGLQGERNRRQAGTKTRKYF